MKSERCCASIRRVPYNKPDNFALSTADQMIGNFRQITAMTFLVMAVLSSIGLLVGGIGVMNIMLVSVTERTQEIGLRKAVGAKKNRYRSAISAGGSGADRAGRDRGHPVWLAYFGDQPSGLRVIARNRASVGRQSWASSYRWASACSSAYGPLTKRRGSIQSRRCVTSDAVKASRGAEFQRRGPARDARHP